MLADQTGNACPIRGQCLLNQGASLAYANDSATAATCQEVPAGLAFRKYPRLPPDDGLYAFQAVILHLSRLSLTDVVCKGRSLLVGPSLLFRQRTSGQSRGFRCHFSPV